MRALTLAVAGGLALSGPVAAQQRTRPAGDSVEIALTVVLAGGDPVAVQWSRWIGRSPATRALGSQESRTWRSSVTIDTRQRHTAAAERDPTGITLHAPDLSREEQGAALAALRGAVTVAISQQTVLGADPTILDGSATAVAARAALPPGLSLDPARPRHPILVIPEAQRIPSQDRIQHETIRFRLPGHAGEGDTIWVVVADEGRRRWIAAAVLGRRESPPAAATQPAAPTSPRAGSSITFAVGQRPGDVRGLPPGFSLTRAPLSLRVQQAQGGGTSAASAGLVVEVREHGVTALEVAMPRSGTVSVLIVDLNGRHVARIGPEQLDEGYWVVRWHGQRADGARAAPGIYLAITEALGARVVTRLILTR